MRGVCITTLAAEYPRSSRISEHAHGSDQLIFATRGMMSVCSGRRMWHIPPHFGLWIPARIPHQIQMLESVSMRTLYIRCGLVDILPTCTVLHAGGLLRELILEIVRVGRLRRDWPVERALCEVLIAELERAPALQAVIDLPKDRRALAVARAVMVDPPNSKSLPAMCAEAGISVRTLERLFRRDIGIDFESWRRRWRLMQAIEMLVAGHTVKTVAHAVGYLHAGAFVELFKRTFGTTPKAWIQEIRKLNEVHRNT